MNKRLLSTVAIAALLPSLAFAQQSQTLRDRDPDLSAAKRVAADLQKANVHRGPFYFLSRIRISDAGYTETGYAPTGDNSSGSISLTVEAPQRLYFVPRKKTVFSVDLIPGYTFFSGGDNAGQFNYSARADAHFLLNHLYLNLYGTRSDQLRAHMADINRLATVREGEVGAGGEVKYSSRTSGQFIVRLRNMNYPETRYQPESVPDVAIPVQVLDRTERNARVSLLHKTFPRTSLFVAAEGSDYVFDNKAAYASRRTYFGGGFNHEGGRNNLRVEAGPMKLDFDDPLQNDYVGMTGRLGASRSNGRWGYNLGANRDIGFSVFLDNAFFVSTSGSVGVDYAARRNLTLHARSFAERDAFETPVLGRKRTDDISFTSLGFTYGLRRVNFGVDAGWYERDSTAFGDVDSGIRYVLRLSLIP